MIKLDGKSKDIREDNIKKLREMFPSIDTDGKIDFDKLRLLLDNEIEESPDKYNFTWNGKGKSIRLAQTPSTGTLRPDRETSINFDETENIYIEGDNLEVLKLLQKTYYNKIKMIYIDPPYNTGKDFVYKDNFRDNISNYKEQTSQSLQANPETSGRYHTDWLNMMYPRLMLARNLLTDDGAIFVSIDENEQANLIKILDEIFGEKNNVGTFVRKTKSMTADKNTGVNLQHEYLLVYAKNISKIMFRGSIKDFSKYSNVDNDPSGDWVSADPTAKSGSAATHYPIYNPLNGEKILPSKGRFWAFSKETLDEYIKTKRIVFTTTGRGFIFKRYKNNLDNLYMPLNSLEFTDNLYMNQSATKELNELFGFSVFDYPKPTSFLEKIITSFPEKDFIALDFFSGSSTTAHAIMKVNHDDNGTRKFIMVQLPEKIDDNTEVFKKGFRNITDIARFRIDKASEIIRGKSHVDSLDFGFKSYRLDSSNIIPWDSSINYDEQTLFDSIEVFKEERTEEDILYEILLKTGTFDQRVEKISINNKLIYSIGNGYSIVCLIDDVTLDDIKEIGKLKPAKVVFKENGFKDDNVKLNSIHTLISLGVKELQTI